MRLVNVFRIFVALLFVFNVHFTAAVAFAAGDSHQHESKIAGEGAKCNHHSAESKAAASHHENGRCDDGCCEGGCDDGS